MKPHEQGRYYKQNLLQQLRGFYHVAVTRSFSAAAASMSLEQPSVTLQVQALERELQMKLFDRKRKAIVLTPEGQVLFEVAAPLVEGMESLHETFRERLKEFEGGRVVCASSESIVLVLLTHVVNDFKSRFPSVDLVMHSGPSQYALEMLVRGDADLCIAKTDHVPSTLEFQHLVSYQNYLVVPRKHPLADRPSVVLEDVARYPLVAPLEDGTLWRTLHHALDAHHLDYQVTTRLPSLEARLRCVELGMGVTFEVGAGLACELAPKLAWVPLSDDLPTTTYGLFTRKNSFLSLAAKRFAEFVIGAKSALQSPPGLAPSKTAPAT